MSTFADRPLRRISWLDGQRLEHADLRDQAAREAFTRRLHTSVVHDAWGVALGFTVLLAPDQKGIALGPGVAYDRLGREIVSGRQLTVPAPRPPADGVSHWFDLVVRWADEGKLAAGRDASWACAGAGSVFEERPLVRWADLGPLRVDADGLLVRPSGYGAGVQLGLDVPLARFPVLPDGTLGSADLSTKRVAHGLVRPHIASGTVRQGTVDINGDHRWWSMTVDTADGGFTTESTTYLVALGAHPWGDTSAFNSGSVEHSDLPARGVLALQLPQSHGPFLEMSLADRDHFQLTVRHSLPVHVGGVITAPTNPVPVQWVGIEWVGGCEPVAAEDDGWLGLPPFINWNLLTDLATGVIR